MKSTLEIVWEKCRTLVKETGKIEEQPCAVNLKAEIELGRSIGEDMNVELFIYSSIVIILFLI